MDLTQYHGLGNVFLISFLDEVPADALNRARFLCNPDTGIGADGLIFGTPSIGSSDLQKKFTLFNRDGSLAEISGNGLRCFGQALVRSTGIPDLEIAVDTDAGCREVTVIGGPDDSTVSAIVNMGTPGPGPQLKEIPAGLDEIEYTRFATIDMGNPHLVVEVEDLGKIDLNLIGKRLHDLFLPDGCNVHIMTVIGPDVLQIRTWERGVGITEACGTGACSAAYAAHTWGETGEKVQVQMSGGAATVTIGSSVMLTGPSTYMGSFRSLDDEGFEIG